MSGWLPVRLRPLLGADLDFVTASSISNLIGLTEEEVEFKRDAYGTTEGDRKECAYDIASLANASGGLIVIGVEEDGKGKAQAVRPISGLGRDFGLWVHQVVAERVLPTPDVMHRAIEVDHAEVHLIAVGPSVIGPHAVQAGGGALRYPVRYGNARRWLTESEVADRYRRRFVEGTDRVATLLRLIEEGKRRIEMPVGEGEDRLVWLILALVPDIDGNLALRRGLSNEWNQWLTPAFDDFPAYGPRQVRHVTTGFRSIEFDDNSTPSTSTRPHLIGGTLGVEGNGVVVFGYDGAPPNAQFRDEIPPAAAAVYDENLVGDIVNGLGVLLEHARRTGAVGQAAVGAAIRGPAGRPLLLAQYRSNLRGVLQGTHALGRGDVGPARHTIDLNADVRDRLAVTRALLVDLGSAFGLAEPQQITADLELVRLRFAKDWQDRMERWAVERGVVVIENFEVP